MVKVLFSILSEDVSLLGGVHAFTLNEAIVNSMASLRTTLYDICGRIRVEGVRGM